MILTLESVGDAGYRLLREIAKVEKAVAADLGIELEGPEPSPPCWVAEIVGPDSRYRYQRTFLQGRKDYSRANSVGSRGVLVHYVLQEDKLYEVKARPSWRKVIRYFATVQGDALVELSPEDFEHEVWRREVLRRQLQEDSDAEAVAGS